MITYSIIQYDILRSTMYLQGSPIPGLSETLKDQNFLDVATQDILQYVSSERNLFLTSEEYQEILTYLESVPEINLTTSQAITLRVEIEDEAVTGNVGILSRNTNGTKTQVLKGGFPLLPWIIKPIIIFRTLGNCRNCLKLTFQTDNVYNFTGNLGAQYWGSFKNGQKQYSFYLPNYSSPATYGTTEHYIIFWKPSVTYSGLDFNGTPINIVNENRWIAVPSSSIGTSLELSNKTFFHRNTYISGSPTQQAKCPYYKQNSPAVPPYYNFLGNSGNFLLEVVNNPPGPVSFPTGENLPKPCPQYFPISGSVVWGYSCTGENGCVQMSSGSALYPTYEECAENCFSGSWGFGYICNKAVDDCVQAPSFAPTNYATYNACIEATDCGPDPFVGCFPCAGNVTQNPQFTNNYAGWTPHNPGSPTNNWVGGLGSATFITNQPLNAYNTSSTYLIQYDTPLQPFHLDPGCTYDLCFEFTPLDSNPIALSNYVITFDPQIPNVGQPSTGTYPLPSTQVFTGFNPGVNVINTTFTAGTSNFAFYVATLDPNVLLRGAIDNICIVKIGCPIDNEEEQDCIITGSAFCYDEVTYPCVCPVGYSSSAEGLCVPILPTNLFVTTSKIITSEISYSATPVPNASYGIGKPTLYAQYFANGAANGNSLGLTAPFPGNPNVYNTQYQVSILSASFWTDPTWPSINLANTKVKSLGSGAGVNDYYGVGKHFVETAPKQYHLAILAENNFRVKLNNSTILDVFDGNGTIFNQFQYNLRTSNNPYLASQYGGNLYNPASPVNGFTHHSWHIFPISMSAGCNNLTVTGKYYSNSATNGLAALLLDNTATQIVNASSLNDLNIVFDSSDYDTWYNLCNCNYAVSSSCPSGSVSIGPNPCDGCSTPGAPVPCGNCIECAHGILYNGYVVDAGGNTQLGRGTGGVVNINPVDNPINTWIVPDETEWDTLVTFLNNGIVPPTTTGGLGTVAGGKMKDYVRDLHASCWEFPNAGAEDNTGNSGWAGTAAGKRNNSGVFSLLGFEGFWWSANSSATITKLFTRELKNWSFDVYRNEYTKNNGHSLRLVRPAIAGESNGAIITNAYKGNDGSLYDGIVIGTQVWINKNLSETRYNDGTLININSSLGAWINAISIPVLATSCYYDNNPNNAEILKGNINPETGECYEFPTYYLYQRCDQPYLLAQLVSGSTTTVGKVEKASDYTCWTFVGQTNNLNVTPNIISQTNYFSGSNSITNVSVYDNCDECNAVHTIYMKFGTKNC